MEASIESIAINILRQYPVQRAALFGSAAKGELHDNSDVDMLIEFAPDVPGLSFFGLKLDLEDALQRPVDLITFRSLAKTLPDFRDMVSKEARVIYEQ